MDADTFASLQETLKHRFFFAPAFEIYGGYAGLFVLGPSGTALMDNILQEWRRHFVLEDSVLEIKDSVVTPHPVLKASGHVDRFTDFLVRDGPECFRADKILEEALDTRIAQMEKLPEMRAELTAMSASAKPKDHQALAAQIADLERFTKEQLEIVRVKADAFEAQDLHHWLLELRVPGPKTGLPLTSMPEPFNLMFPTQIGAAGNCPGFLRPELAQGMFVNFKRLYESVGKLPFACAQIGQVYRNEIAPRGGMFRLREFTLAEIEHFCKDDEKRHPKFLPIADTPLILWAREAQEAGQPPINITLGEALATGRIGNETHGYFIGRTQLFLERCGVKRECIRFRQHLMKQMAHYARDCYDAEVKTNAGWIEVVGIADRSCFDLTQHTRHTGVDLVAHERLDPPIVTEQLRVIPVKKELGKSIKAAAQPFCVHCEAMSEEDVRRFKETMERDGKVVLTLLVPPPVADKKAPPPPPVPQTVEIIPPMVEFKTVQTKINDRTFTPAVIEPSFGISRILSTVLEHCFYRRPEDVKRGVFAFPPMLAPIKCAVFPLSGDERFQPVVSKIASDLVKLSISRSIDASGVAIGRRYARADEIGVPFAVTVDFDTINPQHPLFETVTLRERDSCEQIRVKLAELPQFVRSLVEGQTTWAAAKGMYPAAARPVSDE